MVEFGGWNMPVQYRGIIAEHLAVRSGVGVFDLSHMGRLYVRGSGAHALAQWLTVNDVSKLAPGRAHYSMFCGYAGEILDDIIVYNMGSEILLVVNASNRQKLLGWMAELRPRWPAGDVEIVDSTFETAMVGFQGPASEEALQSIVDVPIGELRYYAWLRVNAAGIPALLARTGYTGEDGFELIVEAGRAAQLWTTLLQERGGVTPTACGLGARDTLRLEAGMPLYGHEIDAEHNPYEAGLGRVVKLDKGDFVGRDALAAIASAPVARRLVGFELTEPGVPRQGYSVLANGTPVGMVTSGTMSPSANRPIGMAYVPAELTEIGTALGVEIRGKSVAARVVPTPFVPHRTKRAPRPGAAS
jgi:aminomethyltransferase